ncbi:MAG: hypothetical protein FJ033_04485 [Chloroflexi bacterium]|nr:hypothetical protein [Chloroflexota bacterium]
MEVPVHLPSLGEQIDDVVIGRWLKRVGDRIEEGEPLVEVITDKVNVEIVSPVTGSVASILADEGTSVTVDQAVALVEMSDAHAPSAT